MPGRQKIVSKPSILSCCTRACPPVICGMSNLLRADSNPHPGSRHPSAEPGEGPTLNRCTGKQSSGTCQNTGNRVKLSGGKLCRQARQKKKTGNLERGRS